MATSASASTTLLSANCNERETFLNGQRCGMAPRDDVARRDGMRADGCVVLKHRSQQSTDMSRHCRLWRGYSHFAVALVLCSYFVTHESFVWRMQNRCWWWDTLGIMWTLYRCRLDVDRGEGRQAGTTPKQTGPANVEGFHRGKEQQLRKVNNCLAVPKMKWPAIDSGEWRESTLQVLCWWLRMLVSSQICVDF